MPRFRAIASAIIEASLEDRVHEKRDFLAMARKRAAAEKTKIPSLTELRAAYLSAIEKNPARKNAVLEKTLIRREVRSISGVAIVTVLTKPYPCPGKCVYCPTEAIMPKSYLSNEPAAMRALMNAFDPYRQTWTRLEALVDNGHPADKVELIVKGGTWSAYAWEYQQWFIKRCFDACNQFPSTSSGRGATKRKTKTASLLAAQDANEQATHRIIGLTIETRPDWITPTEVTRLRSLGCTRVELGVQSVSDAILLATKRGHDVASVVRAAQLLKDSGYKTDFHLMPQLPGATPASDLDEIREIFRNPDFRPDMIKLYPCVVVELSELYDVWKRGDFVPYPDADLIETLIAAKCDIPRYCRISRLIRDIPSTSIVAGNMATNLRQTIQEEMARRGLRCACLRCREIGRVIQKHPALAETTPQLFDDVYDASGGEEHFLSFENETRDAVFAFCRLRLPPKTPATADIAAVHEAIPEIRGAAFVRELHTYGTQVRIAGRNPDASQHKGLGRRLMERAEDIARDAGFEKLAVIAGIGVRDYYRKLGYRKVGTYMVKLLR